MEVNGNIDSGRLNSHCHEAVITTLISERALARRIDRKLIRESGERLAKCREGSSWFNSLGAYYTYDQQSKFLRDTHYDLEEAGRELGVLKAWEQLQS